MEPLIRQIENWQSKTASEILAYFQEAVSQNVTHDYKVSDLDLLLGPANCEIVCSSLRAAAVTYARFEAAWAALPITGIELYSDERQDGIRLLAQVAGWPDALRDAVLALGRTTATRWAMFYGDSQPLPTEQAISESVEGMKHVVKCEQAIAIFSAPNRVGKTLSQLKQEVGAL